MERKENKMEFQSILFYLKDGEVDKNGEQFSVDVMDLSEYQKNPVVLYNFDKSKIIGKADNLRWEDNKLIADIKINETMDIIANNSFPSVGYKVESVDDNNRFDKVELVSLALCGSENLDKRIKTIGEQKGK